MQGDGTLLTYSYGDPLNKYIGKFKNFMKDGQGKYYTIDVQRSKKIPFNVEKINTKLMYKGEFKQGSWHGYGIDFDDGEDKYYLGKSFEKTRVKNDKVLAIIKGQWKHGKLNGKGKIIVYY